MNKTTKYTLLFTLILSSFFLFSCANEDGEEAKCPTCDNETQLLVGNKCVNIEDIAVCGPDGHGHGENEPCHCFSGQEETTINGKGYCLQLSCEEKNDECGGHGKLENDVCHCKDGYKRDEDDPKNCVLAEDIDHHACESKLDANAEAVLLEEAFNGEHFEVEKRTELQPLADKEGYVHFPMTESGEFALYVSEADQLLKAYSKDGGVEFSITSLGANEDCSDVFKAVYHIEATRQHTELAKEPVVLKFKAGTAKLTVFAHPAE